MSQERISQVILLPWRGPCKKLLRIHSLDGNSPARVKDSAGAKPLWQHLPIWPRNKTRLHDRAALAFAPEIRAAERRRPGFWRLRIGAGHECPVQIQVPGCV